MNVTAFQARATATVQIAATTTSARVAIAGLESGGTVRVVNPGTTAARVEFGDVTVAATSPSGATPGSLMVPAAAVEVLAAHFGVTHVAAKMESGTATVEFTPGFGI